MTCRTENKPEPHSPKEKDPTFYSELGIAVLAAAGRSKETKHFMLISAVEERCLKEETVTENKHERQQL